MGNQKKNITKYLNDLEEFCLPAYNEFPPIPLYMEQVISYIGECLKTFSGNKDNSEDNNVLTPFMVNNYVKAKIIAPPKDKKYSKEASESVLLTTGAEARNSMLNICDLAGNVGEWTLEECSSDGLPCTARGGWHTSGGSYCPASNRDNINTTCSDNVHGARVALY